MACLAYRPPQGRVLTQTDYAKAADAAAGQNAVQTITSTYDNFDSRTNRTFNTVTVSGTASFNANGTTTTYSDVEGRTVEVDTPASVSTPQGQIHCAYDPATGQKSETWTTDPANPGQINTDITYRSDSTGRLSSVLVKSLDGAPLAMPLETDYFYDLDDNLVATRAANGTIEYRTYDVLNRLRQVETVSAAGTVLAGFSYTLDAAGQRSSEASDAGRPVNSVTFDAQGQVTLALGTAAGRTVNYTYDIDGRLTSELITNVPNTPNRTISSTYDLAGNRRLKLDYTATPQDSRTTYTYDADDRLTVASLGPYYPASGGQGGIQSSDTRYTYDLDGHTLTATVSSGNTTLSTTTNTWNIDGTLAEVSTTTTTTDYAYDAAGNRVAQRTGGPGGVTTSYLNDPSDAYDRALEEYSGTSNMMLAATYVRGLDLLFEDRTGVDGGTSGRSFYAVDGLGSTRALVGPTGSVTDTYTYDAYGDTLATTTTNTSGIGTTNSFQYAGQGLDGTGLYYNDARYYDAAAGRFTSRDSFSGNIIDPITTSKYIYAGQNPVNFIDPSGHDELGALLTSITIGISIPIGSGLASGAVYARYTDDGFGRGFIVGAELGLAFDYTFFANGGYPKGLANVFDLAKTSAAAGIASVFAKKFVAYGAGQPYTNVKALQDFYEGFTIVDPGIWTTSYTLSGQDLRVFEGLEPEGH